MSDIFCESITRKDIPSYRFWVFT